MKTKAFKFLIPMIAIGFAIASAFATNSTKDDFFAPEIGYVQTSEPCDTPVNCSNTQTPYLCTVLVNGQEKQAFGKINPQATSCIKKLYRPM